jgi:hypothetical protein
MKESTLNEISRDFLAVLAGVMTAIAVALLLLPVVNLVANSHFQISVFSQSLVDAWKDDLIVKISLFVWLFLASIAGGTICTLIAANRDIILVLISSMVSIALVFIVSGGEVVNRNHLIISVLIILGIPIGNVLGAGIGWNMKRKRKV